MARAVAGAVVVCALMSMSAVCGAGTPSSSGTKPDATTAASPRYPGATKPATTAPAVAAKRRDYGSYCTIQPEFRDNVALSSDVDHGGLRIGQKGTVRIFVTNTAKMDLIDVALEAQSEAFNAQAKPWSGWEEFPDLKTMRNGGRPQAFEVTLTRKPNIPDGNYNLTFRLLNLKNRPVVEAPLNVLAKEPIAVKRAKVTVDGRMDEAEWKDAPVCTALCDYRMLYPFREMYGQVLGYEVSKVQTRFRVAQSDTSVFFCVDFMELAKCASDRAFVYVARGLDAEPTELEIDRLAKTCASKAGNAGIRVAADDAGRIFEIEVTKKALGIEGPGAFYADFARVTDTGDKDKPGQRHTRFLYDADNPNPYYQQKPGLRLAADKDFAYCQLNFEEIEKKTRTNLVEIEFYLAPEGPTQGNPLPSRFILNTVEKRATCSGAKPEAVLLKYDVAADGKSATLAIPRGPAGVADVKRFFVYALFLGSDRSAMVEPIRSFWRGNQYSISSPYVYEKFLLVD